MNRKNNIPKGWLTALLVLALSISGFSQSLKEDLGKMKTLYAESDFRMDMTVNIYSHEGAILQQNLGEVRRKGEDYYTAMDKTEKLVNSKCALFVDHQRKTIFCRPGFENQSPEESTSAIVPDENQFDEQQAELLEEENNSRTWRITLERGPYKEMDMKVGHEGELIQLTYYYRSTADQPYAYLTIGYSNREFAPRFSQQDFSEKNYVQIKGENVSLSKNYANYELISPQY